MRKKSRLCSMHTETYPQGASTQLGDITKLFNVLHVQHLAPYENCYKNIIYIKKARAMPYPMFICISHTQATYMHLLCIYMMPTTAA